MSELTIRSTTEQTVDFLREEVLRVAWQEALKLLGA